MIGQLLLGLSILVGIHEFGHFATAKYFKIRVDKFYIFFDFLFPLPNVLNFALLKKKIGETEYGLGWFPLGGYVAIHGMIDETQDADALAAEPQPNEFRAKPAWQRLIVMLGGVIMNVITGIIIFSFVIYAYGESYLPLSEVKDGIAPTALGKELGFKRYDNIVKINGRSFIDFDSVYNSDVLLDKNTYYTVERAGQLLDIPIPANLITRLNEEGAFVTPLARFTVDSVAKDTPAMQAGLQKGDQIIKVGNQDTPFFSDFQEALKANASTVEPPSLIQRFSSWMRGKSIESASEKPTPLLVQRGGQDITLQVKIPASGTIGFFPKSSLKSGTHHYNFLESIPRGVKKSFGVITGQIKAFGKIFRNEISFAKSVGGPVEIAQQYGGNWIWERFWILTGSLSMVLAFMNLLPIPALDGGHVIFLLYEMIAGRKPSDKFLENAQKVGTALILALMFFVLVVKRFI
ncbi:site-2 protease family protein [Hymenobacter sp. BT186]|uniref:Site-2 protease family protein n=2 Tax=Hymenobacter telluris TaxID=2816474 RepID=A0A939EZ27_9BACT|nr:site-2 protease family protein [Hymenobacter telluris]MBW3375253.1 site-2 protease family protein [Hymenobacter norwichensis]